MSIPTATKSEKEEWKKKCAKYNLLNFKKLRTKKWGKNFRLAQRTKDFMSKCMDSLEPTLLRWLNLGHFRKMTKFSDKPIKWKSIYVWTIKWKGFPDISFGKEPTCNAGDPSSIPGSGRSTGEGIGYPLQYSWASLVAKLVKNLPAMWETWVQSLGWEDPLEKGKTMYFSILA